MQWRLLLRTATFASTLAVSATAQVAPSAKGSDPAPSSEEPEAPAANQPPADSPAPEPEGTVEQKTEANEETTAEGAAPAEAPPPAPSKRGADDADEDDTEEPELPMTPPAQDSLGGHLVLGMGAQYLWPFGRVGSAQRQRNLSGDGPAFAVDLGYGVSRQVVLNAWGELATLPEGSNCSDCKTTSFAVGPAVRFHLVQGLRFDPWLSFGVGYRHTSLDDGSETTSFSGFDWARVRLGGDWYPTRMFGFGPFLELTSGGYFDRPESAGALRTYWQGSIGLRLVLDFPGKLE